MFLESKLKKIRIKQQDKLDSKNLYLYKSITIYIQNSNLRKIEKEEILQQIMDMMLQAKDENKSASAIIGDDYEEFCKSVIKEYEISQSKTYRILSFIQRYISTLFILSLIMWVIGGDLSNCLIDFRITLDNFILANIYSLILIPLVKKENQRTSSMASYYKIWERIQFPNKGGNWTISILLMLGLLTLKQSILKQIIDPKYFVQAIPLEFLIPIGISIISIIAAIEVYKRKFDNV